MDELGVGMALEPEDRPEIGRRRCSNHQGHRRSLRGHLTPDPSIAAATGLALAVTVDAWHLRPSTEPDS
jgi:hypothetical protein